MLRRNQHEAVNNENSACFKLFFFFLFQVIFQTRRENLHVPPKCWLTPLQPQEIVLLFYMWSNSFLYIRNSISDFYENKYYRLVYKCSWQLWVLNALRNSIFHLTQAHKFPITCEIRFLAKESHFDF